MLVNAWSLQVHNVLLSLSNFCQCFFFFLHDQHYRMSVEWHILWRRSCLPLVKSLYTDSYKGGTVVFLMADILLLTKIRKNNYLSFIRQNTVKFRKYAPMLIFVKGPFWGAHLRKEICLSKSISPAYSWKEIYHFCFVLFGIWGQIQFLSTSLRELIFGGAI